MSHPRQPYRDPFLAAAIRGNRGYIIATVVTIGIFTNMIFRPYWISHWAAYHGPPEIVESQSVSRQLRSSRAVTQYVNPDGKKFWGDKRSITFQNLRDRHSGKLLSDAEILKRLCIGMWGGPAYKWEQTWYRAIRKGRVDFAGVEKRAERGELFIHERPGRHGFELERGDTIDGAFQVLDMRIRSAGKELEVEPRKRVVDAEGRVVEEEPEVSSFIDFGYGSSKARSGLAGVHRLSVTRAPPEAVEGMSWRASRQRKQLEEDGGTVTIAFESYTCSPRGREWLLNLARKYHLRYAHAMFSQGVAGVIRGQGRSSGS